MAERRVFVGVRLAPAGLQRLQQIKADTGHDISVIIRLALKHGLDAAERELTRGKSPRGR